MRCAELSLFSFIHMKADIIVVGGGAAGLMAAYGAADTLVRSGRDASVVVLEKMPRPARKVMITGKGRCNFTNLKDWNEFSGHIRTNPNFVKPSFFNLTPQKLMDFFEAYGMPCVVERGDRAFPESHRASDVVDTLMNACLGKGVKIETESAVKTVEKTEEGFRLGMENGGVWTCRKLIIATGGLSYPGTGSTGDGLRWASELGHRLVPTFPSLTALVPKGYKRQEGKDLHIDRSTPFAELGEKLAGVSLKNVGVQLMVQDTLAQDEFGDIDFTDGGLEGPVGFQISRKAVKSLLNGSRVSVNIDMKHGVPLEELLVRVRELWKEVDHDPRSARLREKEKCRILLGKLMPWDLIPAFLDCHPQIISLERRGRTDTKVWVNMLEIAKALKCWRFEIAGYVGYERCVVTAGGVSTDEVVAKSLESKLVSGLHLCGELLDMDCDTGGYNLQLAFSTGLLAGQSAANKL